PMPRSEAKTEQCEGGTMPRLLFCSYHCYFDPSSGAALATRDLFELLASRGWPCEVFCGPQQDFEAQPPLPQLLNAHGVRFVERSRVLSLCLRWLGNDIQSNHRGCCASRATIRIRPECTHECFGSHQS